jgi:predicted nucleic acid-binding protein
MKNGLSFQRSALPKVVNLDRTEINRLRRRFIIADPYDTLHVVCALFHNGQAIVTYDSHFQTVANVIAMMTPQEALSQLQDL